MRISSLRLEPFALSHFAGGHDLIDRNDLCTIDYDLISKWFMLIFRFLIKRGLNESNGDFDPSELKW